MAVEVAYFKVAVHWSECSSLLVSFAYAIVKQLHSPTPHTPSALFSLPCSPPPAALPAARLLLVRRVRCTAAARRATRT
jgi:hypothetical protein